MRLLSQRPFARGFLVMLFCITLQSFNILMAQSPVTTGMVRDADGKPVAGATINKNGTTVTTVSKEDGSFSIDATTGDELNISFVGYAKLPGKSWR